MRLILTTATLIALPFMAFADDKIEDNVKARQGFFEMLGANMAPLAGMAKGEIAYDEMLASTSAANIEALTKYTLPMHFVEGSSLKDVKNTAAKSEIWANMDDFKAKYAALGEAATGASEAVKGGQANVGPVLGKLGAACKACHDAYREKQ
ncbi:c-type cytochrome [Paracoccus aminophilus]|uniref:Cytochrome c n=1 Tax=Paracoccus aminophilus JCM 7686 TaxID=1367847 RepID=S5Y808_PARAH|nr:cytochrome c [Paracoccus aminophilus]AGT07478.1 cytochrome c [Paracoccus aminophilus JCM 7686]